MMAAPARWCLPSDGMERIATGSSPPHRSRRDNRRMPLAYVIDRDQRLVVITGEYAKASEWTDLLGRVLSDPRRQPGFAFLRDLRGATTPVDTATVIQIMA